MPPWYTRASPPRAPGLAASAQHTRAAPRPGRSACRLRPAGASRCRTARARRSRRSAWRHACARLLYTAASVRFFATCILYWVVAGNKDAELSRVRTSGPRWRARRAAAEPARSKRLRQACLPALAGQLGKKRAPKATAAAAAGALSGVALVGAMPLAAAPGVAPARRPHPAAASGGQAARAGGQRTRFKGPRGCAGGGRCGNRCAGPCGRRAFRRRKGRRGRPWGQG
jgi:hypothetical protein